MIGDGTEMILAAAAGERDGAGTAVMDRGPYAGAAGTQTGPFRGFFCPILPEHRQNRVSGPGADRLFLRPVPCRFAPIF